MTKNKITDKQVDRVCAVVENYGLDKPRLCAALEALTPEPDEQVAALEAELAATYAKLVRTADLLQAERKRVDLLVRDLGEAHNAQRDLHTDIELFRAASFAMQGRIAELETANDTALRQLWSALADKATLAKELVALHVDVSEARKCLSEAEAANAALREQLQDMTDRYHDASGEADRLHDRINHAPAYATDAAGRAARAELIRLTRMQPKFGTYDRDKLEAIADSLPGDPDRETLEEWERRYGKP